MKNIRLSERTKELIRLMQKEKGSYTEYNYGSFECSISFDNKETIDLYTDSDFIAREELFKYDLIAHDGRCSSNINFYPLTERGKNLQL